MVIGEVTLTGDGEVTGEGLTIRDPEGTWQQVRVQGKKQRGVALADGTLLVAPVKVNVRAEYPASGLKPGQAVRFRCRMDQAGNADCEVADVTVLEWSDMVLGVTDAKDAAPANAKQVVERQVTANVKTVNKRKLVVELPDDRLQQETRPQPSGVSMRCWSRAASAGGYRDGQVASIKPTPSISRRCT